MRTIFLTDNDAGQRLDRFLRKAFKATPLSLIQKAIRKGHVRVDGKKKPNAYFLNAGETISIPDDAFKAISEYRTRKMDPSDLKAMIIFENNSLIAINKPSGIPVHAGEYCKEENLVDYLKAYLGKPDDSGLTFTPALVHRLDKDTSGVILAAKNSQGARLLCEQFRDGLVKKTYMALIKGEINPPEGSIRLPLENKEGKKQPAETGYRTTQKFEGYSLLEVRPKTGRTHQIRRHLQALGHPIVGDSLYGGLKAPRLFLHAMTIAFKDPDTGKIMPVNAPLPQTFRDFISKASA